VKRALACALLLVACEAKKKQPPHAPPPPPAPADASTADDCKRRAQDEIMRSDRDISNALAAQKLELFAPQFLQTPFDAPASGLNPSDAMIEEWRKETKPFERAQTGDLVTWKRGETSYTGIYVEPIKEGWLIAKRDNQIFVVRPARWREVTCEDPRVGTGPCATLGPRPLLFALPAGTTFAGTLDLDAERVSLRFTGGPPAPCPP
jgi:hypothetical protein